MFRTVFRALASYLKDWKNLLMHGLIGLGLLLFALFAPVPGWARILVLAGVVAFNILRGRLEKARKNAAPPDPEVTG